MIIVGLTGGIGSGKTTVANMFKELGVPIYIADEAGKRLMNTSEVIRNAIVTIFGEESYQNNIANRSFIASKVFNDKDLLARLNAIIHPAVSKDFKDWVKDQDAEYVIYEAAILFETGKDSSCDFSILVTAPKELKLQRLQKRDDSSIDEIEARMANQWSDDKKISLANFIINNHDLSATRLQVMDIHDNIIKAHKNH